MSFNRDAAERVFWTGVEAVLGAIVVVQFGLPEWAIVPATMALAALKVFVARHVGDPKSAALQ